MPIARGYNERENSTGSDRMLVLQSLGVDSILSNSRVLSSQPLFKPQILEHVPTSHWPWIKANGQSTKGHVNTRYAPSSPYGRRAVAPVSMNHVVNCETKNAQLRAH
jgi:hypothetical protein